jgi:hypothetical protein
MKLINTLRYRIELLDRPSQGQLVRVWSELERGGFRTIVHAHAMHVAKLLDLDPDDEKALEQIRSTSPQGSQLGLELIGSELILAEKAAVYVRFERTTLLGNQATCHVAATYLLALPKSVGALIEGLETTLKGLGIVADGVSFAESTDDGAVSPELDAIPNMSVPKFSEEEIQGALALNEDQTRADLKQLVSAKQVSRGTLRSEGELVRLGLAQPAFTARHKDNSVFVTVSSREQLDAFEGECKCGKRVLDHEISVDVSPTELGRRLNVKNRWMAKVAAASLMGAGISVDAIRIPVDDAPDEIDLAFTLLGDLVLAEIKEDEFHPKDALNLVARTDTMPNARALIITKSSVTAEARRVLDRVYPTLAYMPGTLAFSLPRLSSSDRLQYLEGRECITKDLTGFVEGERLSSAVREIQLPGAGQGLNIRQVLVEHLLGRLTKAKPRAPRPTPPPAA